MKRIGLVVWLVAAGAATLCIGPRVGNADELAKLIAADRQSGDDFGVSVAISGDCALIGAPGEDTLGDAAGAAYVFRFNGSYWVQEAKLMSSDAGLGDTFGVSVAISGDYALVGAEGAWVGDTKNAGAVYAYRFNGSQWSQTDKLVAPIPTNGDCFGRSVAMNGTLAIVGAWGNDALGFNAGAAYVYQRDGAAWLLKEVLLAPDGEGGDGFGIAVALDGTTFVVGASGDNDCGGDSGSAYVYGSNSGRWTLQQKLTAPDGIPNHSFGRSVAIRGGQIIVGAPGDQDAGYFSGAAYGFTWTGTTWASATKIKSVGIRQGDSLGYAVALSNTAALVAARGEHAVYAFLWDGNNWSQQSKIEDPYGEGNDFYAYALGTDGDQIIIGAPGDDEDAGSALICDGPSAQTAPVYRFWSPIFQSYFYTISQYEKDYVTATWPYAWGYEEISYYAYPNDSVEGLIPIYRFWSGLFVSHFYTADPEVRDFMLAQYPDAWDYEGIAFYAFDPDDHPVGTVPVYCFWSENLATHFYTAKESEKEYLLDRPDSDWQYKGITWYANAP